jgi:hypothetical protein
MQHTNDCQCQWCNLDNIIYFSCEFEYVFTLNRGIPLNWNKWWLGCMKKNCNVVFILTYTFNRSFYETSFVLRFFHLYEKRFKTECEYFGWISQPYSHVTPYKLWSNL